MLLFSKTALWYTPGWDPVPIRYVITRDPEGKLRDEVCFCTDPDETATAVQIVEWVVMRFSTDKIDMFPSGGRHGSICAVAETPAGVRLRFRTASSKVSLSIVGTDKLDPFLTAPGGQPTAQITGPDLFDLTIGGEKEIQI